MAIKSSGSLSMVTDIVGEFGGTAPHGLKEYYRGGDEVPDSATNSSVPTSGEIGFKDFYGATDEVSFTISSNQQELNLNTYLTGQGWDGSTPVVLTINSGVYIWSDSTSTAALTISSALNGLLTITNNGYIIGKGGRGSSKFVNAESGGPAISNSASGVTLTNASGAFIAGGGGGGTGGHNDSNYGGGGGGAGGGEGGGNTFNSYGGGGAGGAVGQEGADGNGGSYGSDGTAVAAQGGGAGGGAGAYDYDGSDKFSGTGAGGGRILGSGATGGAGGTATGGRSGGAGGANGSAAADKAYGAAGGGGWGAAGGKGDTSNGSTVSAGSGGAAISGTAISVTNNGTIYGSQA